MSSIGTVKNVLTTTSEQWRPVNNGQSKSSQTSFNTNFDWKTSKEQPPLYKGHFLGVPRLVVVNRFVSIHIECCCCSYIILIWNVFDGLMSWPSYSCKAFIKRHEMYLKSQYSKTYILQFASGLHMFFSISHSMETDTQNSMFELEKTLNVFRHY